MARKTFSTFQNTALLGGKAYEKVGRPASSGMSSVNPGRTVAAAAYNTAKAGLAAAKNSGYLPQVAAQAAKALGSTAPARAINKLKELNAGGKNTGSQEVNPYDQQLAQLEEWRQNQMDYINVNTQAVIDAINAGRSGIESDYADALREAYISQQKNKLASSDYLNAMGYSGGMAESTLADIDNTYQNNRLAGYKVRQNALSQLDSQVAEARNTGNTTLANLSDSYYDKYTSLLDSKRKYEYQKEQDEYQKSQDKQEQANLDRQFKYDKQQDKLKQKNYKQKLKEERYEASLSGRYKTVKGAQNAIKSIKKSGKNTWKIPYIYERIGEIREEQAKAAKKKVSSSSGSSKYYSPKNGNTNAIRTAAKNYVNKHPGVAVNSATVDYYLGTTDYSGAQKEAFKAYMQKYGAGYIRRR